jgi:uncharacterized protein YbaR (Trm112 family)
MPICPKCKQKIDYLINIQSGWFAWKFDGEDYERLEEDEGVDGNVNYWKCPECHNELFCSEEEAREFLEKDEV